MLLKFFVRPPKIGLECFVLYTHYDELDVVMRKDVFWHWAFAAQVQRKDPQKTGKPTEAEMTGEKRVAALGESSYLGSG